MDEYDCSANGLLGDHAHCDRPGCHYPCLTGGSHYHCPHCDDPRTTSMYGHFTHGFNLDGQWHYFPGKQGYFHCQPEYTEALAAEKERILNGDDKA